MDSESPETTTETPETPRLIGDGWHAMQEQAVWEPSATVLVQHPQWPTSTLEVPIEFNETQIWDAYWQAWPVREQQSNEWYGLIISGTSGLPFVEAKGRLASDTTLSVLRHVQGSIPMQLLLRLCPHLWDDMPGAFGKAMGDLYLGYLLGISHELLGWEAFSANGTARGDHADDLWNHLDGNDKRVEWAESASVVRFPVEFKEDGEDPYVLHYLFRGSLLFEGVDF